MVLQQPTGRARAGSYGSSRPSSKGTCWTRSWCLLLLQSSCASWWRYYQAKKVKWQDGTHRNKFYTNKIKLFLSLFIWCKKNKKVDSLFIFLKIVKQNNSTEVMNTSFGILPDSKGSKCYSVQDKAKKNNSWYCPNSENSVQDKYILFIYLLF